jgi:hypothetical protein
MPQEMSTSAEASRERMRAELEAQISRSEIDVKESLAHYEGLIEILKVYADRNKIQLEQLENIQNFFEILKYQTKLLQRIERAESNIDSVKRGEVSKYDQALMGLMLESIEELEKTNAIKLFNFITDAHQDLIRDLAADKASSSQLAEHDVTPEIVRQDYTDRLQSLEKLLKGARTIINNAAVDAFPEATTMSPERQKVFDQFLRNCSIVVTNFQNKSAAEQASYQELYNTWEAAQGQLQEDIFEGVEVTQARLEGFDDLTEKLQAAMGVGK